MTTTRPRRVLAGTVLTKQPTADGQPAKGGQALSLVTVESLGNNASATAIATTVLLVLRRVLPEWADADLFALVVAMGVAVIYVVADIFIQGPSNLGPTDYALRALAGFLNAFILAAAVLGINSL